MKKSVKVGIIQAGPVHLDLEKSMEKAVNLVEKAVQKGAELIVFGETWLCGYPAWLDHCPEVANWNNPVVKEIYARFHSQSVEVPGKETDTLCALARKHGIVICLGLNEKVNTGIGNGTVFNTLITINGNGEIVNHHRKLMPTFTEKLFYGIGDGQGLKAVDTHLGRISSLICWEHWMPLSRQALHNSGEHIHVAVWPSVHDKHQLASRHYAFEGRCFVVAAGQIMRVSDFPKEVKLPPHLEGKPDELILNGGSCIVGPDGDYILEPQFNEKEVIIHEIEDINRVYHERLTLDTSGHYNRNDVFDFSINTERKK